MELITKKIVVELRFPPILKFWDTVYDLFQPLVANYTILNEDKSKYSIRLVNEQAFTEIFHARQNAGLTIENIEDSSLFEAEATKVLDLLSLRKVQQIQRLGVRTWYLAPIERLSYEDAIKKYAENQLKTDNLILDSEVLSDFAVTLEGSQGKAQLRVQSGIVEDREIVRFSNFLYDGDPKVALLHDIDRYRLDLDFPLETGMLPKMVEQNRKLVSNFIKDRNDLFD